MVRRQTWQARRFEIIESVRHFRIESGRPIRTESNLEASQVPTLDGVLTPTESQPGDALVCMCVYYVRVQINYVTC